MYIINITYKVPLETIEKYLESHIQFLNKQYQLGNFYASGKKVPRKGGIILSKGLNKEELLKILDQDPFKANDLAVYELTEFIPSKTCKELNFLKE